MKHVLGMLDVADELDDLIDLAVHYKQAHAMGTLPKPLAGKSFVVVFEKNSTRTRISFELGIQHLGGLVSILDSGGSQLARGESIEDTAAVLGRYADCIIHRAKDHKTIEAVAAHAGVPVVNALTDVEHPCQVLADWMTLYEQWGSLAGKNFAYVGDGNNMCHSYLLGAPLAGMDIAVATPPGYGPDPAIVAQAQALAAKAGTKVLVTTDVKVAVAGADAVATDTWISMGDEETQAKRLADFQGYTVTKELMALTNGGIFLHCLPGHWGHEATSEVAHGPSSVIYDQAENRMWAQMALLATLTKPQLVTEMGQTRLMQAA